jgi:hypothetical protein
MDDGMRLMMEFLNNMSGFGTDPVLSDIMTKENRNTAMFLKDCVYFLSDIDFEMGDHEEQAEIIQMLSQAHDWEDDFVRGLLLGVLIGIITDEMNPVGFKGEMGNLYRLLNALNLERRFA